MYKITIDFLYKICYNIDSGREVNPLRKGSEEMDVNNSELIQYLIHRIEELVRENEILRQQLLKKVVK